MNRAILCAALGASLAMGAMTAASAEDGQMVVNLAGLDLNSVDGAKAALGRIRFSANVFCEVPAGREPLEREGIIDRCVGDMTRKGVDALHAPLVTAMLEGTTAPEQQPIAVALAQK
jgi:UrcA family protein